MTRRWHRHTSRGACLVADFSLISYQASPLHRQSGFGCGEGGFRSKSRRGEVTVSTSGGRSGGAPRHNVISWSWLEITGASQNSCISSHNRIVKLRLFEHSPLSLGTLEAYSFYANPNFMLHLRCGYSYRDRGSDRVGGSPEG